MKFEKEDDGGYRLVGVDYKYVQAMDAALCHYLDYLEKRSKTAREVESRLAAAADWYVASEMLAEVLRVRRGDLEEYGE